jgi:glycerol-3-phosphate dehydrogenase (NAD(P)+)
VVDLVVGVVGGGPWGLALAAAAARTGHTTLLLSRRAHDGTLPPGVTLASDDAELARRARLIVLAVPSGVARDVARSLGAHLDGRHFVVHGVRGLVSQRAREGRPVPVGDDHLETISDVVRDETPARRLGALGGPVVASDLLAGRPSVMVCGSSYPEVNRALRSAFAAPTLRLFDTSDLLGLEWASALVGCVAIAVGYARGMGLSPGLLAAVITRAVEEAARITAAAGGQERTLLGLAGYGDLLASIAQTERPEVGIGEALAAGRPLEEIVREARHRVEAVELTGRIVAWAEAAGLRAPILGALAHKVLPGRASQGLIQELMTGPP